MPEASTRRSTLEFLDALEHELKALPVHRNSFFQTFQRGVTRDQLKRFTKQWYLFGIQFRKILIGLLHNLSDKDEEISLELVRVLYSEFGRGVADKVHAREMLKLVDRLEITRQSLAEERLCPEAQEYIDTIGDLFLHGEIPSALGASYGIETTAGLTYRYLYSGLLLFPDLSLEDIRFFETHLFEELDHGDWLRTALARYAELDEHHERIRAAALLAMEKWQGLWQGLHREVLGHGAGHEA